MLWPHAASLAGSKTSSIGDRGFSIAGLTLECVDTNDGGDDCSFGQDVAKKSAHDRRLIKMRWGWRDL